MADIEKAKTRSIDNLQRLYTFVVGLAVTESLKGLLLILVMEVRFPPTIGG